MGNYIKHLLGSDDDLRFKLKEAKRAGNHLYIKTSISEYEELVSKFKAKIRMVQKKLVMEHCFIDVRYLAAADALSLYTSINCALFVSC